MASANSGKKPPGGKPFQKGKSGNPSGRPKGAVSITGMLIQELGKKATKDKTWAQLFVQRVLKMAVVDGDHKMLQEIWDRMDGKVPVDFTSAGRPAVFSLSLGKEDAE